MAVIYNYISNTGAEFPEQYCRIIEARVEKTCMRYTVGIYTSQSATENPPHAAEIYEAAFGLLSTDNVWQQAYADLKTRWPDTVDA